MMTACRWQEKLPVKKSVCEGGDRSGLDIRPEMFLFSAILNILGTFRRAFFWE